MLFLGVSTAIIGAAARNIGLTPFQIGLLLTIQNIGFMFSVWVSGALSDTYEKPKILMVGSLILAISFFTFYLTGSFWINGIIMLLIGMGVGTYEGVTDAMLLDLHTRRQSLHINFNHFFVTLGSILITVYLIFLQMNWRVSLTQSAGVVFLLAIFYALVRLKNKRTQSEDYLQRLRILSKERLVVVLFIATAMVVGIELGTMGILTTYLMDLREFTQTTSKIGLLVFLGGIAVGRLLIGYFTQKEQISQYLLALFGMAGVSSALMFFLDLGSLIYLSIFTTGLALSGLLPLMITLGGLMYPRLSGTVIGTIKVAIPIGGIAIPFLMSLMAQWISLQVSLLIFPCAAFLAFTLLFVEFRKLPAPVAPPV
jgi:MFS transporter, FHS family, glucose/mannose:H+ symporter